MKDRCTKIYFVRIVSNDNSSFLLVAVINESVTRTKDLSHTLPPFIFRYIYIPIVDITASIEILN